MTLASFLFRILIMVCLPLPLVFAQSQLIDPAIEAVLRTFPEKAEIAIGIYDKGQFIKKGYLLKDGKLLEIENSQALFDIGSITKTFTAALLMQEVEKGNIALDDSIDKHLPFEMPGNRYEDQSIQVWHLVTHTSGLSDSPGSFVFPYLKAKVFTPQNTNRFFTTKQYYKYLKNLELDYLPGQKWRYSNNAVSLLGQLLAEKQGTSWEALVQAQLFTALDMRHSFFAINRSNKAQLVQGYNDKGKRAKPWQKMAFINPSGVIKSTVDDMLKYLAANISEANPAMSFLAATHQVLAHKISLPAPLEGNEMGIGWIHQVDADGSRILWHNGGTAGYKSFMAFDKAQEKGIIILTNFNSKHPQTMAKNGRSKIENLGLALLKSTKAT